MDSLHHMQKFNLERIKDLRVRGNTVRLLEDRERINLHDHDQVVFSQIGSLKLKQPKEKTDKLDFINIKSRPASKDTIKKAKRQPTDWKKKIVNHIYDKDSSIQNI